MTKVATQPLKASGSQGSQSLYGVLGTLQYSLMCSKSHPPSPPPPSNPPPRSLGTDPRWPHRGLSSRETRCRSPSWFRAGAHPPFPYLWRCSPECPLLHRGCSAKAPEMVSAPVAPVKETSLGGSFQDREATPAEPLVRSPLLCPCRTFSPPLSWR